MSDFVVDIKPGDTFTIEGFHICKNGRWITHCSEGRETVLVCCGPMLSFKPEMDR